MGEMAERLNAPVLKTGRGASSSWVRIPLSPPQSNNAPKGAFVFVATECDENPRASGLGNDAALGEARLRSGKGYRRSVLEVKDKARLEPIPLSLR